jgi:hypothetical protein
MRILGEYRGVMFSIPRNDDGVWHYAIHPKLGRRATLLGPLHRSGPQGLPTREQAIAAAKQAIDVWLRTPSPVQPAPVEQSLAQPCAAD